MEASALALETLFSKRAKWMDLDGKLISLPTTHFTSYFIDNGAPVPI